MDILSVLTRGGHWIITKTIKCLKEFTALNYSRPYNVYNEIKQILFLTFFLSIDFLSWYLNNIQQEYYIDEAFHIPQTIQYCAWNFTEWDPKITTLPGLYLITGVIICPLQLFHRISYIRKMHAYGAFLTFYLLFKIIKKNWKSQTDWWNKWSIIGLTYNLILFPPLYFYFFFYYTDVTSVNMVLLMFYLHQCKHTMMTAFAGLLAVLVRQTNIVWLGFFTIEHALDIFDKRINEPSEKLCTSLHFLLIWRQLMSELRKGPLSFVKFVAQICDNLLPYLTVCVMFVAFVIWNGGIVVGDRSAHVATIHVCQIFYFSAFVSLFSWPYVIPHWQTCLRFLRQHWIFASGAIALMAMTICFNTLVHPYILADNRHYSFYVWNRYMGRYAVFKYLLIPIYCASLFAMSRNIAHLRFLTQINYVICVCIVLIPQLLVEPRYFILPYIFYRLNMKRPERWQIICEAFTIIVINFLQFMIFSIKVFYWKDQPYAQRISW
ncbi:PREDICTED: putative Dol-P-Glc:Glc(2)Man(9)GlcNAc(2)-PP-Dol alpha-1,2-glucosyltransferase [Cyphomyrmex costatus]|uniref:Dol-P-Glc:Glc(2)Man(9)GlcNAc(2)-PP-Dol alpha-1,2-glucosyltransferase n=1 Tax=Cyphomyrmex costatus TaxID=456900 RepID=A0A151IK73_9HYME|nr:PREDICTED: putative Dol-P-Glc:Glc(2)Man(9)GlcNAc(2)-PP-Dol alpha-1,2-glucosyltransferase [Cyphomyrmex costatus]KYN03925.1 Putative alpha-1,2-glucosyltransferase ALG10-B [Cyphomyrmex costatus]